MPGTDVPHEPRTIAVAEREIDDCEVGPGGRDCDEHIAVGGRLGADDEVAKFVMRKAAARRLFERLARVRWVTALETRNADLPCIHVDWRAAPAHKSFTALPKERPREDDLPAARELTAPLNYKTGCYFISI
jgi:hypothetical protein